MFMNIIFVWEIPGYEFVSVFEQGKYRVDNCDWIPRTGT
jgi:hypothetical protein